MPIIKPSAKRQAPSARKVIFLVGPTGVGKTEASIQLAKKIGGEIICCDSMQVYKDMDILTAKPAKRQMRSVSHHLFGIKSPTQEFDVAEYRRLALKKISQIHKKGKTPILVGGTGLYAQALLDGLFSSPGPDFGFRARLNKEAQRRGSDVLYQRLKKIDPEAAAAINPNDLRRIIRALEVYYATGKRISQLKKDATKGGIYGLYPVYIFCLFYKNRRLLYEKINQRVDQMFDKGLAVKVEKLLKRKLSKTASSALGIGEIRGFLRGNYGIERAKELLKRNTRRYAKRQMSWFRRDKRVIWLAQDEIYAPISWIENYLTYPYAIQ